MCVFKAALKRQPAIRVAVMQFCGKWHRVLYDVWQADS